MRFLHRTVIEAPSRILAAIDHWMHRTGAVATTLYANRLAIPRGLEPLTPSLGNSCSIQLSYGTAGRDITASGCEPQIRELFTFYLRTKISNSLRNFNGLQAITVLRNRCSIRLSYGTNSKRALQSGGRHKIGLPRCIASAAGPKPASCLGTRQAPRAMTQPR